jgi:hypothetical protein
LNKTEQNGEETENETGQKMRPAEAIAGRSGEYAFILSCVQIGGKGEQERKAWGKQSTCTGISSVCCYDAAFGAILISFDDTNY